MKVDDFDYELPDELIAQEALEPRDAARLLVHVRETGEVTHAHVRDLGRWLRLPLLGEPIRPVRPCAPLLQ